MVRTRVNPPVRAARTGAASQRRALRLGRTERRSVAESPPGARSDAANSDDEQRHGKQLRAPGSGSRCFGE